MKMNSIEKSIPDGFELGGETFVEIFHDPKSGGYPFMVVVEDEYGKSDMRQSFWTLRDALRFADAQIYQLSERQKERVL
jgi:hypothetical protein